MNCARCGKRMCFHSTYDDPFNDYFVCHPCNIRHYVDYGDDE